MSKRFLDLNGLNIFLQELKDLFATKSAVTKVEDDTDLYVTDVDYSQLEFDKTAIIE